MKRTQYILAVAVMAGAAWAQNPDVIDNVRSTMKSVQQKQDNDMKPVLAAAGMSAQPAKASPAQAANAPASPTGQASLSTSKPAMKKAAVSKKTAAAKTMAKTAVAANAPFVAQQGAAASALAQTKPEAKPEEKKWAMVGKRDPFFSPVVSQTTGSGCSTGKKCLDIGQINLRGIVKSGGGFIAVVTNSLDKAYFLKENDPVFNGYVVKITTDSVVFQETMQDKLGKPFTREIVKKIFTPAV
jgi:Tfp pilus assembly protein PilP